MSGFKVPLDAAPADVLENVAKAYVDYQ